MLSLSNIQHMTTIQSKSVGMGPIVCTTAEESHCFIMLYKLNQFYVSAYRKNGAEIQMLLKKTQHLPCNSIKGIQMPSKNVPTAPSLERILLVWSHLGRACYPFRLSQSSIVTAVVQNV